MTETSKVSEKTKRRMEFWVGAFGWALIFIVGLTFLAFLSLGAYWLIREWSQAVGV